MKLLFFAFKIIHYFCRRTLNFYIMDDTLQLTTEIIDGKPQVELILIPKKSTKERTAATITVAKVALEHGIPMAIFSLELSNTRLLAHLLSDSALPIAGRCAGR